MEEEKKVSRLERFIDEYGLIISVIGVYMVYRLGVRQGYNDAMRMVDGVCDSAAKALGITKF